MKIAKWSPMLCLVVTLVSCKKEAVVTRPVSFTATTYQTLGAYDATGKPAYLVTSDVVTPNLLSYIKTTLPARIDLRTTNPELLTTKAIADIKITTQSDVFITFVAQGGDITDAIAFYTYPSNQPPASATDIKVITYVFPNAGKLTPLVSGNKVKIGRFDPGTSVGLVLMQAAWDPASSTLNNNAVHFCSNDVLNPEVSAGLQKHAVLINYTPENKLLIGFEDNDRTKASCDHDFNDVVLYATVTP